MKIIIIIPLAITAFVYLIFSIFFGNFNSATWHPAQSGCAIFIVLFIIMMDFISRDNKRMKEEEKDKK